MEYFLRSSFLINGSCELFYNEQSLKYVLERLDKIHVASETTTDFCIRRGSIISSSQCDISVVHQPYSSVHSVKALFKVEEAESLKKQNRSQNRWRGRSVKKTIFQWRICNFTKNMNFLTLLLLQRFWPQNSKRPSVRTQRRIFLKIYKNVLKYRAIYGFCSQRFARMMKIWQFSNTPVNYCRKKLHLRYCDSPRYVPETGAIGCFIVDTTYHPLFQ